MRRALLPRYRHIRAGRHAGFTLFELVVVVCVVSVMAFLLVDRLQVYKEAAEKASMQQTAAAIKSALQLRVAAYMIEGRDKQIETLRLENPVNWLQNPPENYVGEFYSDAYARVKPGSWYFDLARREFIYVVNLGSKFLPRSDARKWVRYRVKIEYDEVQEKDTPPRKVLSAVSFVPVEAFTWF